MASEPLGIQQMTAEDYDEVAALWQATEGVGLDDHADTREGVTNHLARNPGLSFIARQEGRVIGAVPDGTPHQARIHPGHRAVDYFADRNRYRIPSRGG